MKFYAEIDLQNRIKPLYNSDYDILKKLKKNTQLEFEVKQKRNPKFHRKMFALFNIGFENQETINSYDNYRKIVIMRAGFVDTEITDKGTVYFAKSLAFSSMDNTTFEDVFSKVLDVIAKQLDTKPFEIRNQIDDFM